MYFISLEINFKCFNNIITMSQLRKMCNQYFGTHDFYEILKIKREVNMKEIKKAYHKLSLLVHPDRVDEDKKLEATEKFKILCKIHSILSDENKKAIYDESGEFDDDDDALNNWLDYWRSLFKKITIDDIKNYEKEYIGSETEIYDVKKAYLGSKGKMDFILESVPFANCDREPAYIEIVKKLIEKGEVPEYKSFINEPNAKKERRRIKYEKEKAEAESIEEEELTKAIQENQEKREKKMSDFFSNLEAKYGAKNQKKRKSIESGNTPTRRTRSKK